MGSRAAHTHHICSLLRLLELQFPGLALQRSLLALPGPLPRLICLRCMLDNYPLLRTSCGIHTQSEKSSPQNIGFRQAENSQHLPTCPAVKLPATPFEQQLAAYSCQQPCDGHRCLPPAPASSAAVPPRTGYDQPEPSLAPSERTCLQQQRWHMQLTVS